MVADSPPLSASHHPTSPYQHENPMTPQRASQVFDFLTERRQLRNLLENPQDASKLPAPFPNSAFDSPSKSRFSDNSTQIYDPQDLEQSCPNTVPSDAHTNSPHRTVSVKRSQPSSRTCSRSSSFASTNEAIDISCLRNLESEVLQPDLTSQNWQDLEDADVPVVPSWDAGTEDATEPPMEHRPSDRAKTRLRGPRPSQRRPEPKEDEYPKRATRNPLVSNPHQPNYRGSKDPFTPMPSRRSRAHRRTASTSTLSLANDSDNDEKCPAISIPPARAGEKWARKDVEKENGADADSRFVTPARNHLWTRVIAPPSPASSSELSPTGRQLMTNLREQRMRGREAEKQRRVRLSTGIGDRYRW